MELVVTDVALLAVPLALHQRAAAAVAGSGPVRFALDDLLPAGVSVGRGWPTPDDLVGLAMFPTSRLVVSGAGDQQLVVGTCGTKGDPRDGAVEIGYGLIPSFRGKGVGTSAVAALLDELRADRAISQIVAEVAASNLASQRLLQRLGFALDDDQPGPGPRRWTLAV